MDNNRNNNNDNGGIIKFRIAIIGSHRVRVAKVVSLLTTPSSSQPSSQPSQPSSNDETKIENTNTNVNTKVEYVPCVATFDSYENEKGETVRYLMKIEHHEKEGTSIRGSSLAPFFDEMHQDGTDGTDEDKDAGEKIIPGIAAIAIGCGIDTQEDVEMIQSFINVLSMNNHNNTSLDDNNNNNNDDNNDDSHKKESTKTTSMMIKCIQPNEEYTSMTEENKVYKNLNADEKRIVTELQSMGPGKMAKFVSTLAQEFVEAIRPSSQPTTHDDNDDNIDDQIDGGNDEETITNNDNNNNNNDNNNEAKEEEKQIEKVDYFKEYNTNITRYACRKCRTILFSQNELEDPPHIVGQHQFSSRKNTSKSLSSKKCQSVFLEAGLDWMGDISEQVEGKIECHKCHSKLGSWNWAGNQCSCGTWVTPAIQVALSRVDIIPPKRDNAYGVVPIISPLAALHVAGIRPSY